MKYTLKKPDGTEVTLTRDELVIGYNRQEIDVNWPAKPQGAPEWARVGVLIGVESAVPSQGTSPPSPTPPASVATSSVPSDFPAALSRRYADAYTEAHAVVTVGKTIKGVAVFLFIAILIAGFAMASDSGNSRNGRNQMNGPVAGIGFAIACLIGIPTYVLGILVAAQGQTALATLDTAVNSSRHLKDDDVARVLSKRFSL